MLLTSRRRRPRRLEQAPEFLVLLVPGRGRERVQVASSNVPSQASKPAAPPKIAPLTVTAPATAISPRVVTASSRSTREGAGRCATQESTQSRPLRPLLPPQQEGRPVHGRRRTLSRRTRQGTPGEEGIRESEPPRQQRSNCIERENRGAPRERDEDRRHRGERKRHPSDAAFRLPGPPGDSGISRQARVGSCRAARLVPWSGREPAQRAGTRTARFRLNSPA